MLSPVVYIPFFHRLFEYVVSVFLWYFYACVLIIFGLWSIFLCHRKGDYYRYLAEFKSAEDRKEAADQSLKAYEVCFTWFLLLNLLLPLLLTSPAPFYVFLILLYTELNCYLDFLLCCRLLLVPLLLIWPQLIQSDLALLWTSLFFTMRSWTPLRGWYASLSLSKSVFFN